MVKNMEDENFRQKLMNWLISKTSRTFEAPGGASQSLIKQNQNQIAPVVSAMKKTQPTPTQPAPTPLNSTLGAVQKPIAEPIAPPMTAMQGQALVQPNLPPQWAPKIGSRLPMGPEEKERLIDAMIQKESSGVATAEYTPKGKRTSRGLMQLEEPTWKDISAYRKKNDQEIYSYDKYWKDPEINRMYGTQYIYEVIPDILTKKKVPVTFENVMASYTPGIGEFEKGDYDIRKYPNVLRDIARIQKFYE